MGSSVEHEPGTALTLGGQTQPAPYAPEAETSATAVAAREKAAVEARYLMAMHRPRNVDQARLKILDACKRPKFAEAVRYAKPVGAKKVYGLSIQFAEEAARHWGNLDVSALIVFDNREKRIYRVWATDLETNTTTQAVDVLVEKTVERKVLKEGQVALSRRKNSANEWVHLVEATEDDLLNKSNALLSKARRNAILSMIPSDIKEEAEDLAIETSRKRDAEDPAAARKSILDSFWTMGVTPEQVQSIIGRPLETINPAELQLLRSLYKALKDGETTWPDIEAEFVKRAAGKPAEVKKSGTAGLAEKLGVSGEASDEEMARRQP